MFELFEFFDLIGQIAPPAGEAAQQAAEGGANDQNQPAPGLFGNPWCLPAMALMMVVYFVLMMRPQKKEQAKAREFLKNLKKNDKVITAGGIIGTVVNIAPESTQVTIKIDENTNTKIKILRSSIIRVVNDEDKKDDKETS